MKDHADVFRQLPPAVHRGAVEAYIRGASHRGLRDEDLAWLFAPWSDRVGQDAFYRQIEQADESFTDDAAPQLTAELGLAQRGRGTDRAT